MPYRCCVALCTSISNSYLHSHLSFHSFPNDDQIAKEWLSRINPHSGVSGHAVNTSTARVCELHFTHDDYFPVTEYTKKKTLKKEAIPSKLLHKHDQPPSASSFGSSKSPSDIQPSCCTATTGFQKQVSFALPLPSPPVPLQKPGYDELELHVGHTKQQTVLNVHSPKSNLNVDDATLKEHPYINLKNLH